ncbi:uncharacterized protein LOC130719373 [Lotus japonicus]|uniref:uncharacterized protein LOC130719373 n=1 Tax=Lotus japonicus TaxID=34305 RepID=UPI00258F3A2A|nr:uncharacterized protein LOC130719373 [Lotus japonicus]
MEDQPMTKADLKDVTAALTAALTAITQHMTQQMIQHMATFTAALTTQINNTNNGNRGRDRRGKPHRFPRDNNNNRSAISLPSQSLHSPSVSHPYYKVQYSTSKTTETPHPQPATPNLINPYPNISPTADPISLPQPLPKPTLNSCPSTRPMYATSSESDSQISFAPSSVVGLEDEAKTLMDDLCSESAPTPTHCSLLSRSDDILEVVPHVISEPDTSVNLGIEAVFTPYNLTLMVVPQVRYVLVPKFAPHLFGNMPEKKELQSNLSNSQFRQFIPCHWKLFQSRLVHPEITLLQFHGVWRKQFDPGINKMDASVSKQESPHSFPCAFIRYSTLTLLGLIWKPFDPGILRQLKSFIVM